MEQHSIFRLASKYMHHDMIEKYTEFPDFPHCRTRLLQIFLNRGEAETDRNHHLYALVVSILQVGLDTHDGVENGTDPADFHKTRGQQLKVLAGDYCSSRFYHLLSEAGQIDMVQRMSAATCEVNRLKVNLYMKMRQWKLSAEEYLLQTVNIKSQLFLSFSHLMEGMYRKHWPRVLRAFTRCEVLANEWDRVNRTEMLRESWAYWYLLDVADPEEKSRLKSGDLTPGLIETMSDKYRLKATLQQMLETQFRDIFEHIGMFPAGEINRELHQIGDKLRRLLPSSKALEEFMR